MIHHIMKQTGLLIGCIILIGIFIVDSYAYYSEYEEFRTDQTMDASKIIQICNNFPKVSDRDECINDLVKGNKDWESDQSTAEYKTWGNFKACGAISDFIQSRDCKLDYGGSIGKLYGLAYIFASYSVMFVLIYYGSKWIAKIKQRPISIRNGIFIGISLSIIDFGAALLIEVLHISSLDFITIHFAAIGSLFCPHGSCGGSMFPDPREFALFLVPPVLSALLGVLAVKIQRCLTQERSPI